jgi:TonB family protein
MGYQALLFCPDEKTAHTVTRVLNDLDFSVEPCSEPFAAVKKLMAQHFDAVVVDCDNEQNATLLFKSARNSSANQSSLAVAVVEGQAGVAKAFRIGANLVLTRPINVEQAKGTLRVARGLLRKGADAKGAGAPEVSSRPSSLRAAAPTGSAPAPAPSKTTPSTPRPSILTGPSFAAATSKSAPVMKAAPAPAAPVRTHPAAPAPPPMASAHGLEVEDHEPDAILEPDDAEVLEIQPEPVAKPAPPARPAPAAGTPKFPWQPTAKPFAEPMASALRRAAEAAAKTAPATKTEPTQSTPPMGPGFVSAEDRLAASSGMSGGHAGATAAAPAKEKPQPAPSAATQAPAKPVFHETEVSVPRREEPAASSSSSSMHHHEVTPPTFFPGGYDEEEAEGGKTKALIIVAVVVLLAGSAGYLSWRDMRGKDSPQTPSTQNAPGPANTGPTSSVGKASERRTPAEPEVSEITLAGGGANAASAPTAKPSATKPAGKQNAAPPAAEPAAEPEVTQRLIVRNDNRRVAPRASAQEQDSAQEPKVDLNAAPDAKTLAGISKAVAAVPTPSPQVVKVSQGVMEGLILKRVQPRYPVQAMQMRIQGSVQLQATISKTGDINNLKVNSGDGILARAAQEAVKQWKYKPYYLNGEPVEIQTQILVNFKLPN